MSSIAHRHGSALGYALRKLGQGGLVAVTLLTLMGKGPEPDKKVGPEMLPTPTTISGVVAVGAPVAGATVQAKCAGGSSASATTDAAGRYTLTTTVLQMPCVLKASGGRIAGTASVTELVSVLMRPGSADDVANVTPLTHLLAARLFGSAPELAFAGCCTQPGVLERINAEAVAGAQAAVFAELRGKLNLTVPDVSWVSRSFVAEPSNAMDGALEELSLRLTQANKTFAQAVGELAAGAALQAPAYPLQASCRQGLISGSSGALSEALVRIRSANRSEPGDYGGTGAEGGGVSGEAGNGVGIGGSLGQFKNVAVTVELPDGRRFGPVTTDTLNGAVTFVHCGYAGPALVTFEGAPGSGATYYDEARNLDVSFEGQSIRAAVASVAKGIGVTPFTEAAVQYLSASLAGTAGNATAFDASGVTKGLPLKAVAQPWHDAARIGLANARVLTVVNDQLPGIYRLDDITRVPTLLNATNANSLNTLPDNQNGIYGAVLAGFARGAGNKLPGNPRPALEIAGQFASDLSDGVLDRLKQGDVAVSAATSTAYTFDSLWINTTTNASNSTKAAGSAQLSAKRSIVYDSGRNQAGSQVGSQMRLFSDSVLKNITDVGEFTVQLPAGVSDASSGKPNIGLPDLVYTYLLDESRRAFFKSRGSSFERIDVTELSTTVTSFSTQRGLRYLLSNGTLWKVTESTSSPIAYTTSRVPAPDGIVAFTYSSVLIGVNDASDFAIGNGLPGAEPYLTARTYFAGLMAYGLTVDGRVRRWRSGTAAPGQFISIPEPLSQLTGDGISVLGLSKSGTVYWINTDEAIKVAAGWVPNFASYSNPGIVPTRSESGVKAIASNICWVDANYAVDCNGGAYRLVGQYLTTTGNFIRPQDDFDGLYGTTIIGVNKIEGLEKLSSSETFWRVKGSYRWHIAGEQGLFYRGGYQQGATFLTTNGKAYDENVRPLQ